MQFLPYNNPAFHPVFGHQNTTSSQQSYPQCTDSQHQVYTMPRRANSMTDLNQMAKGNHGDKNDTKPRLSKGEVEILERQFQEQHKPSSNIKRQLADRMNVDIARINNWFQNRRAKAKQEKKQVEFGLREAGSLSYSEPSSPDRFTPAGYLDNSFQAPESHLASFPTGSDNSAPANPYQPPYENPAAASVSSLQRTLREAEAAVTRGEFNGEFHKEPANDQFGGPLSFNGFSMSDHAQFPVATPHPLGSYDFNDGMFASDRFVEPLLAQPIASEEPPASQGFGWGVAIPVEHHAAVEGSVPTFPSQLLVNGQTNHDLTPRPYQVQNFAKVEENTEVQSPPVGMESRFKSPPPPADIAARRSKPRPAALGTSALNDRTSTGPKTANNSEAVKRMHGSPAAAMRRVASASGLNVLAGRIQKSSHLPQRSPLTRHFSAEGGVLNVQNAHAIKQMSLRNRSWLNKPPGPPTPRSPPDTLLTKENMSQQEIMQQEEISLQEGQTPQGQNTPSSSQSESDGSYPFDRAISTCFTANGLMANMVSPPETPANPNGIIHWAFDVPDDALLTPGVGSFPADGIMQMPQPQYVSSLASSQPPTPAFGQFSGFPYSHHSPVFEMAPVDPTMVEYYFPESSFPPCGMVSSNKSSPEQPREKIYTFNNATQKDFES